MPWCTQPLGGVVSHRVLGGGEGAGAEGAGADLFGPVWSLILPQNALGGFGGHHRIEAEEDTGGETQRGQPTQTGLRFGVDRSVSDELEI